MLYEPENADDADLNEFLRKVLTKFPIAAFFGHQSRQQRALAQLALCFANPAGDL